MVETIGVVISAGGLMFAITSFMISRYDKKMSEREKVINNIHTELKNMQLQMTSDLKSLQSNVSTVENKVTSIEARQSVVERDTAKLECTIENQIDRLSDKIEKVYTVLLEMNKSKQ